MLFLWLILETQKFTDLVHKSWLRPSFFLQVMEMKSSLLIEFSLLVCVCLCWQRKVKPHRERRKRRRRKTGKSLVCELFFCCFFFLVLCVHVNLSFCTTRKRKRIKQAKTDREWEEKERKFANLLDPSFVVSSRIFFARMNYYYFLLPSRTCFKVDNTEKAKKERKRQRSFNFHNRHL